VLEGESKRGKGQERRDKGNPPGPGTVDALRVKENSPTQRRKKKGGREGGVFATEHYIHGTKGVEREIRKETQAGTF